MHPKNPFIAGYNFSKLVKAYPLLNEFVFVNKHGNTTIKFSDKHAVKALNKALLKAQYKIDWDIPEQYLCPPIPGRLDYLLHIADLVPKKNIHLLDIGTGANLIYPILGSCHFNWKCVASETDNAAIQNAQQLIDANNSLVNTILRHQSNEGTIFEGIIKSDDVFDVVVCNPPFFKSAAEAQQQNQRKVNNLKIKNKDKLNFGGRSNELWCEGGEQAFIKQMIHESAHYKTQVHWFTSLVANKEHLKSIKKTLNSTSATEVKVIAMNLGNKQSRFIAWTFS